MGRSSNDLGCETIEACTDDWEEIQVPSGTYFTSIKSDFSGMVVGIDQD